MSAANEFIARWKKSDGKPFDEQAKLKEARALLVKGAVSQEEFDEMSQYCAQRNPKRSEADKKGMAASKAAPAAGGAGAAEEPTMEGFLLKRTADGSSWKKLYFKLFEDRLEFSAKRESAALGKLLLGKEFFVADSILKRIKNMRQNGFMVSDLGGPASTFYLAADSPENKTYWIHTIGSVLRKLKEADPVEARLSRGRAGSDAAERDYQQRLASAGKLGREDSVKSAANRRSLVEMSVVEAGRKPKGGKKGGETGKAAAKAELRLSTSVASGRGGRLSGLRGAAAATAAAAAGGGRSSRKKGGAHARASTMRAGSMDSAAEEDKHHADKAAPLQKASSRVQSLTRNEKTMSTASAAMSAHESARESVRSNLGLNVMSFGEQEDLHDKAAEAERVRALKTMENTAAAQRLAAASAEKRELRAELKRAKDSKDESLIASAEAAYLEAKHEERDAQNALVRSAAERTEAADVNRTTEHILAEAQAANSIVLELSKLDPVALADGDKDKARARVQQAASKVREEALADARAKQKEIDAAEAKARKAETEAADRAERERKATETLGAKKATDDKARKAAQAALDEATKARAEADRLRMQAELDAARLEREKMDAIAKADAVEKALKATQELLEKERAKNSGAAKQHQPHQPQDDLGFAALRKDKEEEHRRQAVQRRTSAGKPGPQDKPAAKEDKRRSSLMNRLLPSRSAGAGAKPANPAVGKGAAAAAAAAAPPRAPANANANAHKRPENPAVAAANASDSGPIEASDSFATFLNGWTGGWAGSAAQGAAEGLEYLTGLRLASDGDESTIGDSSTLDGHGYRDEFDSDDDEDEQDDYHSEDEGAAYDNKLSAVTDDERRKAAKAWIEFEINRLTDIIEEVGIEDEYGRPTVSFGQLLDIYESISDTLVGILLRAKKAGRVWYDGDVLFEVEHDNVIITLVDPEDDA